MTPPPLASSSDRQPGLPQCPNCHVSLEPGMMLDRGHHDFATQQEWTAGPSEPWLWNSRERKSGERLRVYAGRCPQCGAIQHFAPTPGTAAEAAFLGTLTIPPELDSIEEQLHWLADVWALTSVPADEDMVLGAMRAVVNGTAPSPLVLGPITARMNFGLHRSGQPDGKDAAELDRYHTVLRRIITDLIRAMQNDDAGLDDQASSELYDLLVYGKYPNDP